MTFLIIIWCGYVGIDMGVHMNMYVERIVYVLIVAVSLLKKLMVIFSCSYFRICSSSTVCGPLLK